MEEALTVLERRQVWLAGSAIFQTARRLIVNGNPAATKSVFVRACADAPPRLLDMAFKQAAEMAANDRCILAMVEELRRRVQIAAAGCEPSGATWTLTIRLPA
jgi:hypothetical protein